MFDKLIRELKDLDGQHQLSIPIPSDAEGYFDRECPSAECQFAFKIHEDDWSEKVRDEEVFCPFCGHTADSDSWWTHEQLDHAEKAALAHIEGRIEQAMKQDATQWNRRQPRNSFINVTMKVDNHPRLISLPSAAAEPMQLKICCPECQCRYAVIGAAFFCPACGHNAASLVFNQSITGIRNSLNAANSIRTAIPDRDTAETTVRLLIENGLQQAVTAFQRYAEALYAKFPAGKKPRRNAFQNLSEGSDLWHAVSGHHYAHYLDDSELNQLIRHFQQRHLLAHTQGIVDADYITRTGDTAYRAGQRIVIREAAVHDCLTFIEKLTIGMTDDAP